MYYNDGDGSSSSFEFVKQVLNEKFGGEYPITKENCIDHKHRGAKCSAKEGVRGSGRLTDVIVDRIQT